MATYKATIIGNGLAESKEKKTPSIHLQLKAEFNLETKESVDKTLYADLWLSDKAKDNTVKTLRDIGFEGTSIAELNTPCLVGYEVEITTYDEEYKGQMREKVNFVNAVGSYEKRGVKPLDDSITRSLSARYDSLFRNTKATNKPSINKSATAPQVAPTAPTSFGNDNPDEDLPW